MDYRETTVTVHGTTRTIRTEQTGTVRQMETAHTRAVRAAIEELHAAGKADALAAAQKAARAAAHAARNHASGPLVRAADDARRHVKRIEKFKPTVLSFSSLKAMTRPHPPVKFDLDPTDARFDGMHEHIDPNASTPAPARPARKPGQSFLDHLLATSHPAPEPDDADIEAFLNDFFRPVDMSNSETVDASAFKELMPSE